MTVIPIVQGNLLRLGIALQVVKITSVEGVVDKQVEDFYPNPNFPVRVLLTRGSMVCEFTATMEGNVAVIEDKGTVHVGKYAVTVLCRDDDGNPMRFKQKDAVSIVDLTAEAGIVPGAEFETGTQWLDGAVFLSLTSGGGGGGITEETDPTVPQHVKNITQQDINNWDSKQDELTFDDTPTDNSTNMVRSGGIKAYVDNMIARLQRVIDVITQGDDTQDIIDTFNEVVDFLAGIDTDDPTLFNQLKGLDDAIKALQRAYDGLATVATSGDYRDLNHKPTIPDAQVQSDWSQSDNTKKDFIKNKPNLSNYVTTSSLNTTLAGYAGKNGSESEAFNTNLLQVSEENGETVTLSTEYDDNDDVVILHINSSYGGDLSFAFTGNEFGTIATEEYVNSRLVSMPIVDGSAMANEATFGSGLLAENLVSASQSITIDAGKYYDFGERPLSGESGLAIFPKEQCEDGSNAYSYVGRFTIDDSFSGTFQFAMITARKNINNKVLEGDTTGDFAFKLPDEVEFTAGHTYEFNILYDACFIKDITVEEGS